MKSCVVIRTGLLASALIWANTPTLAGEKTLDQRFTDYTNKALETCRGDAVRNKDIKIFHYCLAGMFSPIYQGKLCIMFAAGQHDPGFQCDSKGMLYYEAPNVASAPPMTKEQFSDALDKSLAKHRNKSMAHCLQTNVENKDVANCLEKLKGTFEQVLDTCLDVPLTKAEDGNYSLMARSFDHCIEYKARDAEMY